MLYIYRTCRCTVSNLCLSHTPSDLLRTPKNKYLLEAALKYHTIKKKITPKRKIVDRSKKEYRLTSKQGIAMHLMASLAWGWYPVSGESIASLLDSGEVHRSLHDLFTQQSTPLPLQKCIGLGESNNNKNTRVILLI